MRSAYAGLAALLLSALSAGYAQDQEQELTVEERVAQLESQVARLETQLLTRTTSGAGSLARDNPALDATARIDELERRLESLTFEVQRLAQQLDMAEREASDARRTAMAAERAARDALLRSR